MLDIDFLRAPLENSPTHGAIIYVYRSGAVRKPVRDALQAIALRQGAELGSCDLDDIWSAAPEDLIPTYRYCQWPSRSRAPEPVDKIAGILLSGKTTSLALIMNESSPLLRHPSWQRIKETCLVIEEAAITKRTLRNYLTYLDETTDLAPPGFIIRQENFLRYFNDVSSGGEIELTELIHRFDEIVLTRTDLHSNLVSPPASKDEPGANTPALLRILREIVEEQKRSKLIDLVGFLSLRREQGRSCIQRHIELYSKSTDLMAPLSTRRKKEGSPGPATHARLLWCAVLLAWDERLQTAAAKGRRTPEMFVIYVDQMARDFLTLVEGGKIDPLMGLWPLVLASLQRTCDEGGRGLPNARRRLVRALVLATPTGSLGDQPPWILRLQLLVMDAGEILDLAACDPEDLE